MHATSDCIRQLAVTANRAVLAFALPLFLAVAPGSVLAFDHNYAAFDALLTKHVKWNAKGVATAVDYAGFARDQVELDAVAGGMSEVGQADYNKFSRDQKLAFLINAYNAQTVRLILTKYPDLKSIKDLGGFLSSPWKKKFFRLLGKERHLDWVEHSMIRAKGVFNEPRIHFVVNCASIGCPALRPEAMKASMLEKQLADSTRRFFSDRSRNRYDSANGKLLITKLFDWYGEDFAPAGKFLATYAKQLADDPADQAKIKTGSVPIDFLSYDWKLNKQ